MKGSISLGSIYGIKIEINGSWLVVFALITYSLATNYFPQNYPEWTPALMWSFGCLIAVMLLVSILLHELCHSLVSKRLGINVKRITLFIFGGMAEIEKEPDSPAKEFKIALAGPAMSLLLFFSFWLSAILSTLLGIPEYIIVFFSYIAGINLTLAIFNLIPAFPMDGGRVLRALIWQITHNLQKATKITTGIGRMFGYLLSFIGVLYIIYGAFLNGIWLIFIGFFISQSAKSSYQSVMITDLLGKTSVRKFMTEEVVSVDEQLSIQDLVELYFLKYKFVIFPVRRQDEIVGIINITSIQNLSQDSWKSTTVKEVMLPLTDDMIALPEETVADVLNKLFGNEAGRVLVMEQNRLIGIVTRTDVLNYLRIHSQLNS